MHKSYLNKDAVAPMKTIILLLQLRVKVTCVCISAVEADSSDSSREIKRRSDLGVAETSVLFVSFR